MNEQLIKFIELCLADGVITDKEREVIFRKSKDLGVPDDECEILIDSLVSKHSRGSNQSEKPKKKGGFFSSMFNEIKNNIDTESIKSSLNQVKNDFQKGMENSIGNEKTKGELKESSTSNIPSKDINSETHQKDKNDSFRTLNSLENSKCLFQLPENFELLHQIRVRFDKILGKCFRENQDKPFVISYNEIKNLELDKNIDHKIGVYSLGLRSGIIYDPKHYLFFRVNKNSFLRYYIYHMSISEIYETFKVMDNKSIQLLKDGNVYKMNLSLDEISFFNEIWENVIVNAQKISQEQKKIDGKVRKKTSRIEENRKSLIREFDVDNNGKIDIIENNDFQKLIKVKKELILLHEKKEGKNYTHQFVQISNYLKNKSKNIQELYKIIRRKKGVNIDSIDDYIGILRNQIHTYNLLFISSFNMVISLIEDDRITFYEIYETFDKLNIFTSNHEKEMSMRLKNIESKLDEVVQSIYQMEMNICSELYNLQFITEDMSDSLSGLSQGLSEINSSIQTNNLLTGIQTYQMYKVNKNTKSLRG